MICLKFRTQKNAIADFSDPKKKQAIFCCLPNEFYFDNPPAQKKERKIMQIFHDPAKMTKLEPASIPIQITPTLSDLESDKQKYQKSRPTGFRNTVHGKS